MANHENNSCMVNGSPLSCFENNILAEVDNRIEASTSGSTGGGGGSILTLKKTLTAAEINNAHTTEVVLIEDPGTGKFINLINKPLFYWTVNSNSSANGKGVIIYTQSGGITQTYPAMYFDTSSDTAFDGQFEIGVLGTAGGGDLADVRQIIYLNELDNGGNFDGTLTIVFKYEIIDFS